MTPDAIPEPNPRELLAKAIEVLTAAARLTRPVLRRDEAASAATGRPVWMENGRREPADWAEFVSLTVAGAAANVGGIETALAGRPGSWEADLVRQLLTGTVGHNQELLWEHRTEPLRITLYVDEILTDAGAWDPYDVAASEITRRWDAIGPAVQGIPGDPAFDAALAALPPLTEEQERQADELAALKERLEQQRLADWTAYGEALKAAVLAAVARRLPGLAVPVEVVVDVTTFRAEQDEPYWPDLEWELVGEAAAATPLPGDGRPPLKRLEDPAS